MECKIDKIIRRPDKAEGGITADELEQMKVHNAIWIKRAFRTDPINKAKITAAIKQLYLVSGLKEPKIIIVPSPLVMAIAGSFASILLANKLTYAATDAATRAATRAATYAATDAATDDATRDATYAATDAATRAATYAATDAATRAATYAATYDATRAATYAATDAATRAATYAATYDATDDATRDATRDATYDATLKKGWALEVGQNLTRDTKLLSLMLQECSKWYSYYQGGNMWPAYDCYLTAARDILGLKLPIHEKYKYWEECAIEGGFRFMHKDFCLVSDFPSVLKVDESNRSHCENGPSHLWRDGWALYHWHGFRISDDYKWIITNPEKITSDLIDKEENAEIKRVMLERFGMEKYLLSGNAKLIDESIESATGNIRQLYQKTLINDIDALFLKLINSTPDADGSKKEYIIPVHPECRPILHDDSLGETQEPTALNAVASTYGLYGHEYNPQVET